MQQQFELPGISCENCKGSLTLHIEATGVKISILKIKCNECSWEENIFEKGNKIYGAGKKRAEKATQQIAKALLKLKDTLPKDGKELGQVVTNPKHPFTAFLLTGLVIVLMELSGFGVFMAVTWILSNLILNPVGWVLVPIVVAVFLSFRGYFRGEKIEKLKGKLKELEQRRDAGDLIQEEFEMQKDKLLKDFFD